MHCYCIFTTGSVEWLYLSVCICIHSGFDAVYHIVIIFLHMNFGVVVSLFFIIINIQCQVSWCFFLCWTQRDDKKPGGCWVPLRWFAMVSVHLSANNVGCWSFWPFHLCSGAVGAMWWVYWAQSPDVEGLNDWVGEDKKRAEGDV
jgi:hypothetical protein